MKFEEIRIGDVVSFQNGFAFKSKDFSDCGRYPVIKIKELKDGLVKFFDDSAKVDVKDETTIKKYIVQNNDILFALTGDPVSKNNPLSWVGRISLYRHEKKALLNQRVCKAIFSDKIDSKYFYYYFRKFDNFFTLASKATGSASQANISTKTIEEMKISLPDLKTQQRIASILSSVDDKIELNNHINKNLEQQAQAVFDYMFPNFMKNTISMNEIIDIRDGTHDSPKSQETGYPLITSKHLLPYSVNKKEANLINEDDYKQVNERSKVEYGDILISMIGTVGLISFVSDNPVDFAIKNVGLFKTSKNIEYCFYILSYLKSKAVLAYIEQHLAGTTQKYISLKELRNLPVNVPTSDRLTEFNLIVKPIYKSIITNIKENQYLAELRDILLPKLMNGEIDVSEVKI